MSYEKSKIVLEILQELKSRDDNTINQQDKLNIAVEMHSQIVAVFEEKNLNDQVSEEFEYEINELANIYLERVDQSELESEYVEAISKYAVENNTRESLLIEFLSENIITEEEYKEYLEKK